MKKYFHSNSFFKIFFYLFLVLFLSGIFVSIGVKAKTKEYLKILEHSFSSFSPNGDGSKDEVYSLQRLSLLRRRGRGGLDGS